MDIGKRLRELREANGLSQSDVEDRYGLPRSHVSLIENGRSTPSLHRRRSDSGSANFSGLA